MDFLIDLDTRLFLFLNGLNSPFWDPIMVFVSGRLTWLPFYMVLAFFIFRKFHWRGFWVLLFVAVVVTVADQSSVQLFKDVFQRLRPCRNPELVDLVKLVNNRCGGGYSFVSSHATNTFAVAAFLLNVFRVKPFQVLILFWAALVSYSRVYLGVHYPADILGGAILGLACGYGVWHLMQLVHRRFGILGARNA